jgi:hypothetical protein
MITVLRKIDMAEEIHTYLLYVSNIQYPLVRNDALTSLTQLYRLFKKSLFLSLLNGTFNMTILICCEKTIAK